MKNDRIRTRLTKRQVLTVPNLLSALRLLLLPLLFFLYFGRHYVWSFLVILLSALTDVVDGWIARRFNMTSDLGKFLDPLADKATQLSVLICLACHRTWLFVLVGLFGVKELAMLLIGVAVFRKTDTMPYAHWYGKASTVLFDASLALAVLLPDLPDTVLVIVFSACLCMALFALCRYLIYDLRMLRLQDVSLNQTEKEISHDH